MSNLSILSFLDDPFIAGYSLRSIFEYWWLGLIILIILIVAALALVATYFLLSWLFGRMRFKEGDKESLAEYCALRRAKKDELEGKDKDAIKELKRAKKAERKEFYRNANRPVRNVIRWKKMRVWLIPVVCVSALLLAGVSSFLPSTAFQNLLTTLKGSHVDIIDTEASRAAAAEAENNVVSIQEEGTVLLKNNGALPINLEQNKKVPMVHSRAGT